MLKHLFLLALILNLVGCINFDYVGQKLTATPLDQEIVIYPSVEDVPVNFKPIGRGRIIAPSEYTRDEIEEYLTEKAHSIGADAVAVNSFKRVLTSVTNQVEVSPEKPSGNWNILSTTTSGNQIYTDSFGQKEGLKTIETKRYRIEVKVVFLVQKEKMEKLLKFDETKNTKVKNENKEISIKEPIIEEKSEKK